MSRSQGRPEDRQEGIRSIGPPKRGGDLPRPGFLSTENGFAIALALLCVATILVTLATELPTN